MDQTALRRIASRSFHAAALALCFAIALMVGVAIHADTPLGRRLASRFLSQLLSSVFAGRVEVSPLTHAHLDHVATPEAVLHDEYGRRVLELHDVRVSANLIHLAREALGPSQTLNIVIPHIRVERADVLVIRDDKTGEPTIARALAPPPRPPSTGPHRIVRVWLPHIEVGSARGHVHVADLQPFQVKVAGVRGELLAGPEGVAVDVARFGATLKGFAGNDARGTATLSARLPGLVQGTFEGFYGDVEFQGDARLDKNHLTATIKIPGASPEAMSALVPGWPLKEDVSGDLQLEGEPPNLTTHANMHVRSADINAHGLMSFVTPLQGDLDVSGRGVDLRAIWPDAPATALGVQGHVALRQRNGELVAQVQGRTAETTIAGQAVPPADIRGELGRQGFAGHADVYEPGMPLKVDVRIGSDGVIDLDATAPKFAVNKVPRIPHVLDARGSARLKARIKGLKVDAQVTADVSDVHQKDVDVGRAHITGRVRGSLDNLDGLAIDAKLEGTNVRARALAFPNVTAHATGQWHRARFDLALSDGDRKVNVAGLLLTRHGVAVQDASVQMQQKDMAIRGKVSELDLGRGIIDVDEFAVSGVGGEVAGSFRLRPELFEAEIHGEDVDLGKLSRAVGMPGAAEGKVRINAEVATGRDVTRGRVRLAMGNVAVGPVAGLSMNVSAELEGKSLTGEASGLLANVGTFGASFDTSLGGPAFEVDSWRQLTGHGELIVSEVNLGLIKQLLGKSSPIERVDGRAYARFLIERRAGTTLPNVFATAMTRGLAIVVRRPKDEPPLRIEGIDLNATGGVNGENGDSSGTLLFVDSKGELGTMTGAVRVDLPALLAKPQNALAQLLETPFDVVLRTPERAIADLPTVIRLEGLSGSVQGSLYVKGTLRKPTLNATVNGHNLVSNSLGEEPVDLRALGQYEPEVGRFSGRATATVRGQVVALAAGDGVWTGDAQNPWTGHIDLNLEGLPLSLFSGLARNDVRGRLAGDAKLVRSAGDGSVSADISIADASIQSAPFGQGTLRITSDGPLLDASLRFGGERGSLNVHGSSRLDWSTPLPTLDASRGISGVIEANKFDLVALSPLLHGVVARVGGQADANIRFALQEVVDEDSKPTALEAATQPAPAKMKWSGSIIGDASVVNGVALFETLGLELRDVRFHARARGTRGSTVIDIENMIAKARSSKDNVFGSAELLLEGPVVQSGTAVLRTQDLPLLLHGVLQGRSTGIATAKLTRKPSYMVVQIDIPKLVTRLPRASSRNVLDLEANPEIAIVQEKEETEEASGTTLPWQLILALGDDVRIRRSDVDLGVTGTPVVELGTHTDVYGTVDLTPGGRIPILGKVFRIDEGTIYFDTGDSANPRLDVTAEWRAPDGTTVIVDVTGTMKDQKVALRSDPPMPEQQVFAVLLGGASSTEPVVTQDSSQTQSGTGAAEAVGIGSGVAALGVNELLSETPVELRVGTTSESRPRYTAAVRVGEDLWFEASTYQRTEVGSEDRNVFSGTIDYRFTRRWSLRTEVGTAGGAVDLLWQYRY